MIPDGVIEIFHRLISFWVHKGPGVDTASNRNEYQGLSVGGKGGWCTGLTTLPLSFADCLKILGASTSWTPMGLSGIVQGLAVPSPFIYTYSHDLVSVGCHCYFVYVELCFNITHLMKLMVF